MKRNTTLIAAGFGILFLTACRHLVPNRRCSAQHSGKCASAHRVGIRPGWRTHGVEVLRD